ncbi:MAG: amidohydrolase [Candidatus Cybelea sp.]
MDALSNPADLIFTNADVVTMDDARPKAQAVAIAGGRILGVGSTAEIEALKSGATRVVDLGGKALLPGFVDGHSHFFQVALVAGSANVSAPPVGNVSSIAEIVATLKEYTATHPLQAGQWLIGFGYDGSALSDGREATHDDLDAAFPDTPVLLIHVSAHGCLLNSAALKLVGINASTPTSAGGVIARKPGTNDPTGSAYFTQPYLTDGPNGEKNYCGAPVIAAEEVNEVVAFAYDHGAQVLAHCNGDAAVDMMLEAHRVAGAPAGRRTTIIHSQFARRDQLQQYADYGFVTSFFTNHAYFWGDVHVKNLGQERAFFLSPMRTARGLGIPTSNHSDFFVTPLDPLFIAWTAVNRLSRSGQVSGPDERVTPHDAFKALTIDAAYQYGEQSAKGSIVAGKVADLVVLDRNPLEVDPLEIKNVRVVRTIKEGQTIYEAAGPAV